MFGRVTHARHRCKARALSVYLTHILSYQQQLHIEGLVKQGPCMLPAIRYIGTFIYTIIGTLQLFSIKSQNYAQLNLGPQFDRSVC